MKFDLFKNNRKVLVALLLCSGFFASLPVYAADEPEKAAEVMQQQKRQISGVVKDISGEPVIGASVVEKGTTNGTITDLDGRFSLSVAQGATIEISYIGYKTQTLPAAPNMNVELKEDTEVLDEVVVVGFGVQKKINLTGSVGMATAEDLDSRPVANAVLALQGVIPGLNISNYGHGGELNASKSIDIRGTGTIGEGSDDAPLILIDGIEGDLTALNPQDIESISVLKDAAASSIYGSRAPFGVVLVTTKSGKSGRTQVNYNFNYRIQTPLNMPKMANSWEFVNLFNDANYNGSGTNLFEADYMQLVYDYMMGNTTEYIYGTGSGGKWNYDYTAANVDWLHEYYKSSSPSMEHNVSVSGGTDKIQYYVSANYMDQEGFMRYGTDTYDRYTTTAKISAQVTNYLKVEYNTRWVRTDYARPTSMGDSFYENILRRCRPVRAKYDPNGHLMSDINYINALENGGRYKEQNDVFTQQFKLTFTPLKNWNIIGEFNIKTNNEWTHEDTLVTYAYYTDGETTYVPTTTSSTQDSVYEGAVKETYLNPTVYSNYSFNIDQHNFAVMLGFQAEIMKQRTLEGERSGLTTSDLAVLDQTTNTTDYSLNGEYNNWKTAGFFGRINYDFDTKYLLEFNLRYDGSSRFRSDNRWIWTPSFSLGWNMAREKFWGNLKDYVQTFKLRGSFGKLANQNTTSWYPTYQTMTITSSGSEWLQSGAKTNTSEVPSLISTSLTWETIQTTNIGFDFGAFNNRLTGSFDYYWRKTKDMVGPGIELPATLGTDVPVTNNCDLTTYGWELSVSWRDKIGQVNYGVKLSLSDSKTRVDSYANPTNSLDTYIEGELIGNIYGYTTIGIAKTDEEMEAHLASLPNGGQTAIGSSWAAGDIMYADINGDGKVDNGSNTLNDMGDLKLIGNNTPRYRTGITIDAQWKNFDFSMFWQGVLKRDYMPGSNSMVFWGTTGSGQWWSTSLKEHMDYFRAADTTSELGANVDSYYPRPLFSNKNHQAQTRYLQNAAYMRLKNLQLGYTLPKSVTHKLGIENVRFYVSGENLLTITSLSSTMDPETAGIGSQGGTVYPLSRTYSFGVSINF